ncbi:hypothetical protein ACHAP8_003432 [Fusarium lateritium]
MDFHHCHEEINGAGYAPSTHYLSQHEPECIKYQDLADRIDPLLQYHAPCSGGIDGTISMQRYLQGPPSSFFATPHHLSVQQNAYYNGVYPNMSSSLHHNSHLRHGSPVSYQYSSAASGPQSPPLTDNDGYVDSTQGPSTPSDTAVLSPHIASLGSASPSVSLYGVSGVSQGYVNPAVIQPAHPQYNNNHVEEELPEFTLDLNMDLGVTASTSICPTSGSSNALSAHSPEFTEEFEGHAGASYPEIEGMDVDAKVEDETAVDTSSTMADDDDDDEYKPSRKAKSFRTPRVKTRRGRTTRSSPDRVANTSSVTKSQRSPRTSTNRSLISTSSSRSSKCIYCGLTFSDAVLLQKHITAVHNRPFTCVFHFAGCTQVFANKNEWKRHVSAQHLNLNYWLCTSGSCGNSASISKGASDSPTHCRVFRRKDLYTQHIRRMHAPPEVAQADKKDKAFPLEWMAQEKDLQDNALRQRCTLPTFLRCPAEGCTTVFDNGPRTWDSRMEHVAIHLERAANNKEPPVIFGGDNDEALTQWASQPDVRVIAATATGWATCQPLKAARMEISKLFDPDEGLDEDAEGEEC